MSWIFGAWRLSLRRYAPPTFSCFWSIAFAKGTPYVASLAWLSQLLSKVPFSLIESCPLEAAWVVYHQALNRAVPNFDAWNQLGFQRICLSFHHHQARFRAKSPFPSCSASYHPPRVRKDWPLILSPFTSLCRCLRGGLRVESTSFVDPWRQRRHYVCYA